VSSDLGLKYIEALHVKCENGIVSAIHEGINVLFELEQELPKQQYKMEKRTEGY
jgi:hypothetical protein